MLICPSVKMGNLLGGSNNSNGNSFGFGQDLQCCDEVVDPISLLTTIGAIGAASAFLRQAVIDNMVMGARRKKRSFDQDLEYIFSSGKGSFFELK